MPTDLRRISFPFVPTSFVIPRLVPGVVLLTLLAAACSPRPRPAPPPLSGAVAAASAQGVLPALAELPVLVLPVQRALASAQLGWTPPGGSAAARQVADSLISDALLMRGVGSRWQFAEEARRTARRNPTHAADPDALAISSLFNLNPGDQLVEPLASELRGLIALGDARHVLLPLAMHAEAGEGDPAGTARVVFTVSVVDARLSRLLWTGPVPGEPATEFNVAAIESAATNLANLIVAR